MAHFPSMMLEIQLCLSTMAMLAIAKRPYYVNIYHQMQCVQSWGRYVLLKCNLLHITHYFYSMRVAIASYIYILLSEKSKEVTYHSLL